MEIGRVLFDGPVDGTPETTRGESAVALVASCRRIAELLPTPIDTAAIRR